MLGATTGLLEGKQPQKGPGPAMGTSVRMLTAGRASRTDLSLPQFTDEEIEQL